MYNLHPYIPLQYLGEKVRIIHGKIWYLFSDIFTLKQPRGEIMEFSRSWSTVPFCKIYQILKLSYPFLRVLTLSFAEITEKKLNLVLRTQLF